MLGAVLTAVLDATVSSLVALLGVYLGARLTDRNSKRTELRNEYLYCVSIFQRLAKETLQSLSDFTTQYESFEKDWKEGKRDPVRAVEERIIAKTKLNQATTFNYLSSYEGFKKSKNLDFLPETVAVPLTSHDSLNDVLLEIYLQLVALRGKKLESDVFLLGAKTGEQIEAIRDCLKACQPLQAKLESIVKQRYSRLIETS